MSVKILKMMNTLNVPKHHQLMTTLTIILKRSYEHLSTYSTSVIWDITYIIRFTSLWKIIYFCFQQKIFSAICTNFNTWNLPLLILQKASIAESLLKRLLMILVYHLVHTILFLLDILSMKHYNRRICCKIRCLFMNF